MKLGANHPMGPLALADLIGPTCASPSWSCSATRWARAKYRPAPLLRKMVGRASWAAKAVKGSSATCRREHIARKERSIIGRKPLESRHCAGQESLCVKWSS